MELARGVHALEVTVHRDDREMTIFPTAVETDHGTILVDVGLENHVDAYLDALHAADLDLNSVTKILITHQDGDHAGALAEFADATEATVYAHRLATPFIDGERSLAKGEGRYPPVPVDVQLVEGVSFRTWAGQMKLLFTPGHTPGHVSLYFPDAKLLLAADALTAADNSLQPPNERFTLDWEEALDSVGTLADLDVDRVLCYHGGLVQEGTERITEIAAEH